MKLKYIVLYSLMFMTQAKADDCYRNIQQRVTAPTYASLVTYITDIAEQIAVPVTDPAQLPWETKERIFAELCRLLLGNEDRPFAIISQQGQVSQLDAFLLLSALLVANHKELQHVHDALLDCYGTKELWKVNGRLNKPEIIQHIPEPYKDVFCSSNLANKAYFSYRIRSRMLTY